MFSLWIPLRLQAATPLEIPQEVKATSEVEDGVSTAPRTAQDQVRFIQASMGLTLLHLARVLNVERQTIYNWLQGEQAPVLQNRTRTRLNEIAGVAHQWNTLCSRPLGKLVTGLDLGGFTLLDLLSQTQLDDTAVKTAMQKLAQEIDSRKQRQQPHLRTSVLPPETMDDRVRRRATSIPLDDWPSGD
jgi:transcriptional regulator with XRE-family HTH domain